MRLYLAGLFEDRARLRVHRDRLEAQGHTVMSSWLDAPPEASMANPEGAYQDLAMRDLREIRAAERLIVDTLSMTPRGGREFELGYAWALGIPLILVGPCRHVFHYLIEAVFPSWDAFWKEFSQ